MSGIKRQVKNAEEKAKLIDDYLAPDVTYLKALDALKEDMVAQGVDLETGEGKKQFILAVRELNEKFGTELHKDIP